MEITEYARTYLSELKACLDAVSPEQLRRVSAVLQQALEQDRVVYLAGNGGSAATASHIASDLARARAGQGRGLRAVSLTDNLAALTASANDTSYTDALAELVALQLRRDDVLVLISGSGSSPNVIRAAQVARQKGATVIGLLGFGGGPLAKQLDHLICTESRNYGVVESLHLTLGHLLAMQLAGAERMQHPDRRPRSSLS